MKNNRFITTIPGDSWLLPVVLVLPLGLVALGAQFFASSSIATLVTEIYIRLVAALAIYMFSSNTGIISYGHVAFMGIGAYASAWQTCCVMMKPITMNGLPDFLKTANYPVVPAALAAGLLAALLGLIVSLVIMRLNNIAAAIGTFALLFIFQSIYGHWDSVTMGVSTMIGLPQYVTPVHVWVWVAIAIVVAFMMQNSFLGVMLRASRDEHTAARACGARIFRYRVIAFTISTFFAGIAGVLLGHRIGTISVATFYLDLTFMLLAMVVVGGLRSMSGVLLGVIIVSLVMDVLRTFQTGVTIGGQPFSIPAGSVQIGIALVMILMLRLRPEGILKGLELDVGSWFRRNAPARVIRGADSGAPAAE